MHPLRTVRSYLQATPRLITIQLFTSMILGACYLLLQRVARWALASEGRVAVTTGDFAFLVTSPSGILLILLAIVTLYVAVTLDLNVKVAFSGRWVRGEDVGVRAVLKDSVRAMRRLLCPTGLLVVLYVALLAPIVGAGLSVSLTERLKIPTFITSVIDATPLYSVAYSVVIVVFALIGLLGTFVVQGIVLDDLPVRQSVRQSFGMIRDHWVDFLLHWLALFVVSAIVVVIFAVALVALAAGVVQLTGVDEALAAWLSTGDELLKARILLVMSVLLLISLVAFALMVMSPFYVIMVTRRYYTYKTGERVEVPKRPHYGRLLMLGIVAGFIALSVGLAYVLARNFDAIFPAASNVRVIAHRACGAEGPENTAAGIKVAQEAGAWGAEIDIQRTADGTYVVNHDNTFERVAGDTRKPSEMTLAEVKQLSVHANPADPSAPGEPVSTYEEMLEAARDTVVLFVELKGETADRQMADDAVRIAREHDMLDQCVFISLGYDLIDYLEDTYDDVQTGFLTFAGFGDVGELNCDYLALEELVASNETVNAVHRQGKKVLVWTVNDADSQRTFLYSGVDAIITDNMTQAQRIHQELAARGDYDRVLDRVIALLN